MDWRLGPLPQRQNFACQPLQSVSCTATPHHLTLDESDSFNEVLSFIPTVRRFSAQSHGLKKKGQDR